MTIVSGSALALATPIACSSVFGINDLPMF
jgi:hypothetical protein